MIPKLVLITDPSLPWDELLRRLALALSAGPGIAIQLRDKAATSRVLFERGQQLKRLCEAGSAPLFINGHADVARALDVNVHLGGRDLLSRDVRPLVRKERLISVAVHGAADVENARAADFALVSPVFAPISKPADAPALGPDGFATLVKQLPCPALALGGVEPSNARTIDAAGYASIGGVLHAPDPAKAAQALLAAAQ